MAWLDGWDYRRNHTIRQQAGAGINYQIKTKIFYGALPTVEPILTNGWNTTFHDVTHPAAYYYNGKTYVVYMGAGQSDPWIVCYNHATNTWSDPVKVADNPIPTDNHGAPSVLVTDDGYIHVFYGCHSTNVKHERSTNPEDISAWTARPDIAGSHTYPIPVKIANGDVYLYTRCGEATGHNGTLRKSTDNCLTWGAQWTIIECEANLDRIYVGGHAYDSTNNRIHYSWGYFDNGVTTYSENIYHAYYNTVDGNMYSMDGTNLGTTITKAEADANCLVFDSGAQETIHAQICLDSNGSPFIIFTYEEGVDDWRVKSTRWTGVGWTVPVEITGGAQNTCFIGHNIRYVSGTGGSATLEVFRRRAVGTTGIIKVISTDGGSTWGSATLILEDDVLHLVYCWVPENYVDKLQWVFAEHDNITKAYAYGEDGFVNGAGGAIGLDGHAKSDFSDVRFTEDDGETELDYWIEEKVDDDYAIFWVEVSDDLSGGDVTIYIYYGNAGATYPFGADQAEMNATFPFADQFYGVALDGAKWDITDGNGTVTLAGGECTIAITSGASRHQYCQGKTAFGQGYSLMSRSKMDACLACRWVHAGAWQSIPLGGEYIHVSRESTTYCWSFRSGHLGGGTRINRSADSPAADTYYKFQHIRQDIARIRFFRDDAEKPSITTDVATGDLKPFFGVINGSPDYPSSYLTLDWVAVRKYVNPEPAHGAWGNEENAPSCADYDNQADCEAAGCCWCDGACQDCPCSEEEYGDGLIWIEN